MQDAKYTHDEEHHNLLSPSIIVPYIIEKLSPQSVIDVGCGIGTFLRVFQNLGIEDVIGVDGEWVNKDLLLKYVSLENFISHDLEKSFDLKRKFDLAISLEVAEHLHANSAITMVENLIRHSDIILFSAAFPGQGGQNHINEQWPDYWAKLFGIYNYGMYDVFRTAFWNNSNIDVWYKQNMFLVLNNNSDQANMLKTELGLSEAPKAIQNYIHPLYFNVYVSRSKELEIYYNKYIELVRGKGKFTDYIKWTLKFILRKLGIYNK